MILLNPANSLNAFVASIGLSFVIIPIIASLTEDALHSIPNELRMASYGLVQPNGRRLAKLFFLQPLAEFQQVSFLDLVVQLVKQ